MAPPELLSASGTPAGYGRSCTNCSRAKCKCILRTGGSECERCHRLGKECQPMTTSRRRVGKKTASSRTAQLEEKLDDLVSILRASQSSGQQQVTTSVSAPVPVPATASASTPSFTPTPNFPTCSRLDSLATAATSNSSQLDGTMSHAFSLPVGTMLDSRAQNNGSSNNDTYTPPEPSHSEAELNLNKFREWLTMFPFMVLPHDITAASLRRDRPFLWSCIMNITSMSVRQQAIMKEKIRVEAATRIIVNNERNMDVLLGLIAYLGWATMNSGPGTKPFLTAYVQMAVAIIYDMSLTRAPIEEQYFAVCFKLWGGRPPPPKLRSMEERRALVALWYLTSVISSFIGKMDAIRWTPHMEDCLNILDAEREHPLDEMLVIMVKAQLVGEDAQRLLVRDVMGEPAQAPSYVFKKGMLSKIQEIREGLSGSVANNCALKIHLLGIEIQVHSVGLFMQNIPHVQRIESMYTCLKAIRAWYDSFFSIPLDEVPGNPFAIYVQLSQIQVALYRLTTLEDPAWDKELVRNTADLLALLDRTGDRFLDVDAHYHMRSDDPEGTLFVKGAKIMRNIKNSWEPALSRHLGGLPTPNSQVVTNQSVETPNLAVPEHAAMADPMSMDFSDMTWMTDVFGPWEF